MTDTTALQLRGTISPNLPIAPVQYDPRTFHIQNDILRLYFNQIDARMQQLLLGFNNYGVFCDTTTQTNPVANAENLMTFNTTVEGFGISVDATYTSRIYVAQNGVYNFQFSSQLDKTGGGNTSIFIWFKVNGSSISNSATKVVVAGPNDEKCAAWNYVVSLQGGDYFELAWSSPSTDAVLLQEAAAAPVPAIPSIILTATYLYPAGTVR